MKTGIVIVAHAPLASALRQCVAHVFPDRVDDVLAYDVPPSEPVAQSVAAVQQLAQRFGQAPLLVLTDILGATPCNVACQLQEKLPGRVVAGVNLPMLMRAVTYQEEPLDTLVARVMEGGAQGVLQLPKA